MFYILAKWKGEGYSRRRTDYQYEGKAIRVANDLFNRNHYEIIKVIDSDCQQEVYSIGKEET